jgi:arabinogalactan oligomer/maltooligosaccharide transport system permease protein
MINSNKKENRHPSYYFGAKLKERLLLTLIYFILIVTAILILYPVTWIIIGSFNPGQDLYSSSFFPEKFSTRHYVELFTETNYWLWYKNTLKIAFFSMIFSTFLAVTAAYSFSRFRFPGRRQTLMTMLVLQMFPSFMALIAIFILLLNIGLLDNHWGLILVYSGGSIPFMAWLIKGYFDGLPKSLEEAAKIDGASNTTIFFKVMMPLSYPILVFVAVSTFIAPWMDFVLARVVLRSSENITLAIGLFDMIRGRSNNEFTRFAAGSVFVGIPITVLFLLVQKYMVEGLKAGANKG